MNERDQIFLGLRHRPDAIRCNCDDCFDKRMTEIRDAVNDELDHLAVEAQASRMGVAILIATDAALIMLAGMVVFLAVVDTVPAHAAVLACAAFAFVMWYNHHEAKKNGTIA